MQARLEFFGKCRIYHAVRIDATFAGKGLRHNFDAEMAFTIRMRSGMARMQMRLVDHIEKLRLKGAGELVLDVSA